LISRYSGKPNSPPRVPVCRLLCSRRGPLGNQSVVIRQPARADPRADCTNRFRSAPLPPLCRRGPSRIIAISMAVPRSHAVCSRGSPATGPETPRRREFTSQLVTSRYTVEPSRTTRVEPYPGPARVPPATSRGALRRCAFPVRYSWIEFELGFRATVPLQNCPLGRRPFTAINSGFPPGGRNASFHAKPFRHEACARGCSCKFGRIDPSAR